MSLMSLMFLMFLRFSSHGCLLIPRCPERAEPQTRDDLLSLSPRENVPTKRVPGTNGGRCGRCGRCGSLQDLQVPRYASRFSYLHFYVTCLIYTVSFIYDTFIIDHHSIVSTFFLALGLICLSAYTLWFLVTKPSATVSTHWSFCAEVLLGVNPVGIWLKQTLHSGKRCGIHATPCRIETFRLSSFFPMDYRPSTCQNQA